MKLKLVIFNQNIVYLYEIFINSIKMCTPFLLWTKFYLAMFAAKIKMNKNIPSLMFGSKKIV